MHFENYGNSFAFGQIYTALSRARSFAGLTLAQPIQSRDIYADVRVHNFYTHDFNSNDSCLPEWDKG